MSYFFFYKTLQSLIVVNSTRYEIDHLEVMISIEYDRSKLMNFD